MKKAVVILSGGMDSTTLLYYMLDKKYRCYTLSFNYGQKHSKELGAAKKITAELKVFNKVVDISSVKDLLKSAITNNKEEVPHGHYAGENMKATVVPNRNLIMLSIAAGYARSIEASVVVYGPHGGDHPIYPDCRPAFVSSLNHTLIHSFDDVKTKVLAPFIGIDKTDIVRLGAAMNVPYKDTWSCYEGGELHCGRCGTCVERKEAFALASIVDPTHYKN